MEAFGIIESHSGDETDFMVDEANVDLSHQDMADWNNYFNVDAHHAQQDALLPIFAPLSSESYPLGTISQPEAHSTGNFWDGFSFDTRALLNMYDFTGVQTEVEDFEYRDRITNHGSNRRTCTGDNELRIASSNTAETEQGPSCSQITQQNVPLEGSPGLHLSGVMRANRRPRIDIGRHHPYAARQSSRTVVSEPDTFIDRLAGRNEEQYTFLVGDFHDLLANESVTFDNNLHINFD